MAHGTVNGKPTNKHEDHQQQEFEQQEQVNDHVQALAHKLAQTYEELSRLLERNPGMKRQMTEGDAREDKIYQRLKQRLKMADMAPRCQWVKQDGTACRSPQMKQHIYCFAHRQMAQARELMLMLPVVEDANAIQMGLMRIQKALMEDTISMKKAGLLLYSMQLAMTNVGQTTFGQAKDEEMVRETMSEEEAFSENQHPPRRHGGTEEENDLPRINVDERGLENPKPIFWKPTADMYRMDTPEGREAYEVSLRVKIGTPPRAAVPHEHGGTHDPFQMHAVLG
jgi:cell division septum initiation protein DivIVA